MSLWRVIGLALLVAGIVFLVIGIGATGAFTEGVRHQFTGHYSERTTWYIVGGVVAALIGAGLLVFGGRIGSHPGSRPGLP